MSRRHPAGRRHVRATWLPGVYNNAFPSPSVPVTPRNRQSHRRDGSGNGIVGMRAVQRAKATRTPVDHRRRGLERELRKLNGRGGRS